VEENEENWRFIRWGLEVPLVQRDCPRSGLGNCVYPQPGVRRVFAAAESHSVEAKGTPTVPLGPLGTPLSLRDPRGDCGLPLENPFWGWGDGVRLGMDAEYGICSVRATLAVARWRKKHPHIPRKAEHGGVFTNYRSRSNSSSSSSSSMASIIMGCSATFLMKVSRMAFSISS